MALLSHVEYVLNRLRDAGYEAFLVGGCVRDLMLQREPKDYDVTTNATPKEVQGLFPKTIPVGALFGVMVVVVEGHHIEVATYRADGQYSDARRPDSVSYSGEVREDVIRRDFTINGLLSNGVADDSSATNYIASLGNAEPHTIGGKTYGIIDYVEGVADLQRGVIRAIGDPVTRFTEDALRMLRAVRFAAQLGFEIEHQTEMAIFARAETITKVSKERITAELMKLVSSPHPVKGLVYLVTTGLMGYIMPRYLGNFALTLQRFGRFDASTMGNPLKGIAMLLADSEPGLASHFCLDFKLSNEEREIIVNAVMLQQDIASLDERTMAGMKKLARKPGIEIALDLYEQGEILGLGTASERATNILAVQMMRRFTPEEIRPQPLVTGDDLIAMGLTPGPLFTTLLGQVEIEQLNGVLVDKPKALEFVMQRMEEMK